MANGELVLLYNIDGDKARKLKMIFVQNGIRIKTVAKEDYGTALGVLSGILTEEEAGLVPEDVEWPEKPEDVEGSEDNEMLEEMLVMKGIFGKRLDVLLGAMRRMKATVSLKAVVTEHNMYWNSVQLYHEIQKEHKVLSSGLPMEDVKEE